MPRQLRASMRIYRRASAAWTRRVRDAAGHRAAQNHSTSLALLSRFDCGTARCLSTSGASTVEPRSSRSRPMQLQESPASPASSPGIALLQTMAEWSQQSDASAGSKSHSAPPTETRDERTVSRADQNRVLRNAIKGGDFLGAQRALEALLNEHSSVGTHPVDTESYDQLLYQWSQHLARQRRSQHGPIDLTPMMALLESMVAWQRVNMRSFNTALVACQKVDALDAAERVLSLTRISGRQPGAFAVTNLISCCARVASKHTRHQSHFVGLAERFFQELVNSEAGATIEAVNAMIFAFRTTRGRSKDAVDLVERAMREWSLKPDKSTIETLVVCLLKDKNVLESVRWIEYALNQRLVMDGLIVRSVVDECRRCGQWERIDSLRILLERHGVALRDRELKKILKLSDQRDANTTALSLLQGKPREGSQRMKMQKNDASVVLRGAIRSLLSGSMPTMDMHSWSQVFTHGRIEDLDKVMQLLMSSNVERVWSDGVSQVWLNQLYLQALGAASQWWRILPALDELLARTPDDVDIDCFNSALRSCTRTGRLNEALRVMERMEERHVRPNRNSYDSLIQCCGSVGSVEHAMEFFRSIERSGLKPTILDINAVLKAHATAVQRLLDAAYSNDPDLDVPASDLNKLAIHALRFYDGVTSHYEDLVTTESTLIFLFRSFLGASEVIDAVDMRDFEALSLGQGASGDGFQPDWVLLSDVIQQVCRSAPVDIVPAHVINIGIDYFHRRGEPDQAFELFNTMISRGIAPTSDSIRLLFATCGVDDGDVQLGLSFLDHLLGDIGNNMQSEFASAVVKESLRWAGHSASARKSETLRLVDQVFDKLASADMLPLHPSVYADVAAVFAADGKVDETKHISTKMLLDTGSVSLAVANRVLQACSVARAPLGALNALEWMERHGVQPDIVSYNSVLSAIRRRRAGSHRTSADYEDDEDDSDSDEDEKEEEDADEEDTDGASWGGDKRVHRVAKRSDQSLQLEANLNAVVDKLMLEMEDRGALPDAAAFDNICQIASQRQEFPRLLALFDKIKATAQRRQVEVSALLTATTTDSYLGACSVVAGTDPAEAAGRIEELRSMLATWFKERGSKVLSTTLLRILKVYNALNDWQGAVALIKSAKEVYGVTPNVHMFQVVMETCNSASQFKAVELIFLTMQKSGLDERVYPNAECYVEAIYAIEQQGDWIQATKLFMEMQKKCPAEDLHPALLNRIALGRYAEGRKRPD